MFFFLCYDLNCLLFFFNWAFIIVFFITNSTYIHTCIHAYTYTFLRLKPSNVFVSSLTVLFFMLCLLRWIGSCCICCIYNGTETSQLRAPCYHCNFFGATWGQWTKLKPKVDMVPFSSVLVFTNPSCFCGLFILWKSEMIIYSFKVILTLNE